MDAVLRGMPLEHVHFLHQAMLGTACTSAFWACKICSDNRSTRNLGAVLQLPRWLQHQVSRSSRQGPQCTWNIVKLCRCHVRGATLPAPREERSAWRSSRSRSNSCQVGGRNPRGNASTKPGTSWIRCISSNFLATKACSKNSKTSALTSVVLLPRPFASTTAEGSCATSRLICGRFLEKVPVSEM